MSVQLAADAAGRASAARDEATKALTMMALHLRQEHEWGIRRIGRRLGWTDTQVKKAVGEDRPVVSDPRYDPKRLAEGKNSEW